MNRVLNGISRRCNMRLPRILIGPAGISAALISANAYAGESGFGCGRCSHPAETVYHSEPTYSYARPIITVQPHYVVQPHYIVRQTYVIPEAYYGREFASRRYWVNQGQFRTDPNEISPNYYEGYSRKRRVNFYRTDYGYRSHPLQYGDYLFVRRDQISSRWGYKSGSAYPNGYFSK